MKTEKQEKNIREIITIKDKKILNHLINSVEELKNVGLNK